MYHSKYKNARSDTLYQQQYLKKPALNNSMNILFLNSASKWGGNEKWTHMAAESLSLRNKVLLAYKHDVVGDRFDIPTYRLPFSFSIDPFTIKKVKNIVRDNDIDIIIPTKKRDYVIGGIVARMCGIKNIIRLGIVRKPGGNPYKQFIYGRLADGIIVNAVKIKEALLTSKYIRGEKIGVIYNGLDYEKLKESLQLPDETAKPHSFMVCTVGRISKRKGVDKVLRIFKEFLRRLENMDAGLFIVGSGKRIKSFKKLSYKLGIGDKVYFTGYRKNPAPYIAASDVYLTASSNEGISNALIEAMHMKKPVITTNAGDAGNIIVDGEHGFLFDAQSIEKGAERLYALYSDKELRISIGENGFSRATELFSMERMTDEIISFLKQHING